MGYSGLYVYTHLNEHFIKQALYNKVSKIDYWDLKCKTQNIYNNIGKLCEKYDIPPVIYITKVSEALGVMYNKITAKFLANECNVRAFADYYNKHLAPEILKARQDELLTKQAIKLIPRIHYTPDDILKDFRQPYFDAWYRLLKIKNMDPTTLESYKQAAVTAVLNDYRLASFIDTCPDFEDTKHRLNLNLSKLS